MAINGQLNINIGAPNSPTGSDSLFTAFGKIQNNFVNLFTQSTTFTSANVLVGSGLGSSVASDTITITNTGVTDITISDTNINTTSSNGNVVLSLANSVTVANSVTSANLVAQTKITTPTLVVSNSVTAGNIISGGSITANTITSTTTNAGSVLKLTPTTTPPTSPTQGTIYYDSFFNTLRVYNGSVWGNIAIS